MERKKERQGIQLYIIVLHFLSTLNSNFPHERLKKIWTKNADWGLYLLSPPYLLQLDSIPCSPYPPTNSEFKQLLRIGTRQHDENEINVVHRPIADYNKIKVKQNKKSVLKNLSCCAYLWNYNGTADFVGTKVIVITRFWNVKKKRRRIN